jgi:dienelactone hydrolase
VLTEIRGTVSHYRILSQIGAGGMGVVYLAEDERLHRKVALKFIGPAAAGDSHAQARLLREAQAASTLDHPDVATVYEVGDYDGQLFIAMAYYAGETLRSRIERGPMPIEEAAAVIEMIASGLAAAHAAGIMHRDLKPANIMLTTSGQIKILDFGLAKAVAPSAATSGELTTSGTILGTAAYMAPEQASGGHVDQRTDAWALGVVMFELLTGRLPFQAATSTALLTSILTESPPPLRSLRTDAPAEFETIVKNLLAKNPDERTMSAADVAAAMARYRARAAAPPPSSRIGKLLRRPATAIPLVATVATLIAVLAYEGRQLAGRQWARSTAFPAIAALADSQKFVSAFDLALRAERYLPADPQLASLWTRVSRRVNIESQPPGAQITYSTYGSTEAPHQLGRTPLRNVRIPTFILRLTASKPGFDSVEDLAAGGDLSFKLAPTGTSPPGMVRASAARVLTIYIFGLETPRVSLNAFWIDKYEVTNRQFRAFVDSGGYKQQRFWRQPFVKDGKTLSWSEAMPMFLDATGRPGPATWELGAYPKGQDDYPVTGVSWYEAAAYAEFSHRSLPTIYHWNWVATQALTGYVIPLANFNARAPVRVGSTRALHRFGAYDLAGNVKEWCWNEAVGGKRYIMGGGFDEPPYLFRDPDARSPFDRGANLGIRTVKYDDGDKSVAPLSGIVLPPSRNYALETPVGPDLLEAYRRMYSYDRTDLKPSVDTKLDGNPDWRLEKVTFAAAYGQERVIAYLFLPKNALPPYQTVVYMPGAAAWDARSSDAMIANPQFGFLARSGRAVVMPILKGTYERGTDEYHSDQPKATSLWRDYIIAFSKDLGRTLDYLDTRSDIDHDRMAYFGFSRGAALSPMILSNENRIKTAVLWIPGFYLEKQAPEVDAINFAPHLKIPVLQLSGRYDYNFPDESSSLPFFKMLGTPVAQKKRVLYDTGHNLPTNEAYKETLDWLDRVIGPVR